MTAVAIPKTSESRPPIVPPIGTTFDPTPSGDGDAYHKWLLDNVNRLIRLAGSSHTYQHDLIRRLLLQRRSWIIRELDAVRMLERAELPPFPLSDANQFDLFAPEPPEIERLRRMLDSIEDAILRLDRGSQVPNTGSEPSDS